MAATSVAAANLEAVLISLVLEPPRSDAPAVFTAARTEANEMPVDDARPRTEVPDERT